MKDLLSYFKDTYLNPFVCINSVCSNGLFYGFAPKDKSPILFDRRTGKTGNGFLLGSPGSGVPAAAKQEILNVLLTTNDEVAVIDFYGEYTDFARHVGGEVVPVCAGQNIFLNPLDLASPQSHPNSSPYARKADFLCALSSVILGRDAELSPLHCSIIHNVVKSLYSWFETATELWPSEAESVLPTLKIFFHALSDHFDSDPVKQIAQLSSFDCNSLSMFSQPTNFKPYSRFTVYDLSRIPFLLRGVAFLCMAEFLWERIQIYRFGQTRTNHIWLYFTDVTSFLTTEYSSEYLRGLFLDAPRHGCNLTIVSRDVPSILFNPTAQMMLLNCPFIQLMKQEIFVQDKMSDLFHLTPEEKWWTTDSKAGEGLLIIAQSKHIPIQNTTQTDIRLFEDFS